MENLKSCLYNLEFDEDTIEEILGLIDNEIDIKELYEKIVYLQELGCDSRIIRIIIEENFLFFTTELEDIKKVVNFIKERDLKEYIVNIIEVNPDIISISIDTLKKNENLLKMTLSEDKVRILLRDRTEVFTYNSDYLADRLAFFIKNGLKEHIDDILLTQTELLDLEENEIEIEKLKKKS